MFSDIVSYFNLNNQRNQKINIKTTTLLPSNCMRIQLLKATDAQIMPFSLTTNMTIINMESTEGNLDKGIPIPTL